MFFFIVFAPALGSSICDSQCPRHVGRDYVQLLCGVETGVEGPSRGDPVMGWIIMGCSVRSDNLFLAQLTLPQRGCVGSALRRSRQAAGPDPVV